MPGNPKDSEWYSTPKERRKRKGIEVTLPDEVRDRLDALADARGLSRSAVIEQLVMAAPLSKTKRTTR